MSEHAAVFDGHWRCSCGAESPHERIARLERTNALLLHALKREPKHLAECEGGTDADDPPCVALLAYEQIEGEVEALTQAADTLARGLRELGHGEETPIRAGVRMQICPLWGYDLGKECPGCAALSSWDALKEKP